MEMENNIQMLQFGSGSVGDGVLLIPYICDFIFYCSVLLSSSATSIWGGGGGGDCSLLIVYCLFYFRLYSCCFRW